jgi:hypothetical protein
VRLSTSRSPQARVGDLGGSASIGRRRSRPDQTRTHFAIPVTSVNRTLLDLSLTLGGRALERTFDEADRLAMIDFDELGRICAAAAGNPGTARIRKLAERRRLPHSETRSPLESRFLRFCRDRGLPIPAVNVPVAGYEVDCLWRDARLVVELDSWAHHGDRDSFEADRRRMRRSSAPATALSALRTERSLATPTTSSASFVGCSATPGTVDCDRPQADGRESLPWRLEDHRAGSRR